MKAIRTGKLTLQELELLDTASAYNGVQHKAICGKAVLELIEYKKIEDELGVDLVTLFKALKHFWTFNHGKKVCIHYPFLRKNENCKKYELVFNQQAFGDTGIRDAHIFYYSVWLKDYGKTWALTKEELS